MKIDFTKPILNIDGKPLKLPPKNEDLTIKQVCINALLANPPQGKPAPAPEQMIKDYDLAQRINKATEPIDVTVDEAKHLKDRVSQNYGVLVYGQLHHLIEG